ncbi:uncharacterized protein ARMOST_19548 [Armillaria ostoyae]|uniref:Uncharacterized protein n=1 Tax=Armillaria ostoyae TaxID=47428 RepID=A0A284S4U0_ARMOS|nr:uncharacterized protein ARMOST_19548 [Armillaria ostoyae]
MIYRQFKLLTAILDKGWDEDTGRLRHVGTQARPSDATVCDTRENLARTITCWKTARQIRSVRSTVPNDTLMAREPGQFLIRVTHSIDSNVHYNQATKICSEERAHQYQYQYRCSGRTRRHENATKFLHRGYKIRSMIVNIERDLEGRKIRGTAPRSCCVHWASISPFFRLDALW